MSTPSSSTSSSSSSTRPPPPANPKPVVGSRGQALLPPVKRGSACLRCRKHKLKCDAVKPHCSACTKHHALVKANHQAALTAGGAVTGLVSPPDEPECAWDPERSAAGGGRTSGGGKRARVEDAAAGGEDDEAAAAGGSSTKGKQVGTGASSSSSTKVRALEDKVRQMEALLGALSAAQAGGGQVPPTQTATEQSSPGDVHGIFPPIQTTATTIASSTGGRRNMPYDLPQVEPTAVPDPFVQTSTTTAGLPTINLDNQPRLAHPPWPIRPSTHQHQQSQPQKAFGGAGASGNDTFPPSSSSASSTWPNPLPPAQSNTSTSPDSSASSRPPTADAYPSFLPPPPSLPQPPQPQQQHILPTSYPTRLPPPNLLLALIETFFDRVPLVGKMLPRERFLREFREGPGRKAWPHVAVLHAICAASARYSGVIPTSDPASAPWTSAAGGEGKPRFWGLQDPLDAQSFGARHAGWAREECERETVKAERLLDVAIAHVILSSFDFAEARWVHVWQSSAAALRLCIPLGLNEASDAIVVAGCKPGLLLPTDDAVERETRKRVFWHALMCDRLASISSGWPQSLEEADVTVELPTSDAEFNRGTSVKENTQHLRSPNLFSSHYSETTDGHVLVVKAVVLLARVKQFNRRVLKEGATPGAGLKQSAQFRMVQNQVELFRTTLPKAFRQTAGAGGGDIVDVCLVYAHSLVFTAAIALHEHHVDLLVHADPSSTYVLAAARAQLSLICSTFATSLDVIALPPFIAHCWFIAGRTLARFYQAAAFCNDQFAMRSLRSELDIFRSCMALMGEKIPVAHRQAALLDQAIQDAVHSTEPMKPAFICAVAMSDMDKQQEQKRAFAPSSTGSVHAVPNPQPFADPTRTSSTSSASTTASTAGYAPYAYSSTTTTAASSGPTISPYSGPGSSFSSASSPEDNNNGPHLARPPFEPPPLELETPIVQTPYALLPDFDGADKGLIESLFGAGLDDGSGGTTGGFEFELGSGMLVEGDVIGAGDEDVLGGPMPFALWQ